jgi:hypothetical protein
MKMTTYSDKVFNPENPTANQIDLLDIAVGLSRVPRFVGHTHHFYSVAEHCILTAELAKRDLVDNRLQFLALLHDASEAYVSDIPTPVKMHLKPAIKEIEDKILNAVYEKFLVKGPTEEEKVYLKTLDVQAFELENKYLRKDAWAAILDPTTGSTFKSLPMMTSDQAALSYMRHFSILSRRQTNVESY